MKKVKLGAISGSGADGIQWKKEYDCYESIKNLLGSLEIAIRIRSAVVRPEEKDRIERVVPAILTTLEKQIIEKED